MTHTDDGHVLIGDSGGQRVRQWRTQHVKHFVSLPVCLVSFCQVPLTTRQPTARRDAKLSFWPTLVFQTRRRLVGQNNNAKRGEKLNVIVMNRSVTGCSCFRVQYVQLLTKETALPIRK